MSFVIYRQFDWTPLILTDQCSALCRSPTSRICNSKECEHGSQNDGSGLGTLNGAAVLLEWVALVVLVVADSRHDKVRAIGSDHARLCEAGTGVVLLNGRVDAKDSDEDAQRKVERNEEPVKGASGACEECVENTRKRDSGCVHSSGRAE